MTDTIRADWTERRYVGQFGTDDIGLAIYQAGNPTDVDANAMTVTMQNAVAPTSINEDPPPTPSVLFSRVAEHVDLGAYQITLSSSETAIPGAYDVVWNYRLDGEPQMYVTFIEIGAAQPAYDALPPEMKDIVDAVWIRFADTFDSVYGGPNAQDYFQSHFGRGRIAQLLGVAMRNLSILMNPPRPTPWTVAGAGQFPWQQWGGLLEIQTYIETIKHLIRTYTEQPDAQGISVGRLDRRDYAARWGDILAMEQRDFRLPLDTFRIANMNLGRPHVLVSGGVYGSYAPTRVASSAAARPRFWARFY